MDFGHVGIGFEACVASGVPLLVEYARVGGLQVEFICTAQMCEPPSSGGSLSVR